MPRALDQTWQLLDDFAEAARLLQDYGEQDSHVLTLIGDLTAKAIGADHAAVATFRKGRVVTVAATSDVAGAIDAIRDEEHEGPVLEALRTGQTVRVDDLETDERWPRLGPRVVREVGIRSVISHVLPIDDDSVGLLTVFASRAAAFVPAHESLMAIFGATATATLRAVRRQDDLENFKGALRTSRHIGVALGILMKTAGLTVDDAWAVMVKESQNRNIKVSLLAEHVIATGTFEPPPGGLRS